MSAEDIELLRLLARFKLQLRRLHDRAVDLSALKADSEYAELILAEVEELAEDEELLVLVLQLRERLARPNVEAAVALSPVVPEILPAAHSPSHSQAQIARHYRYGARGG